MFRLTLFPFFMLISFAVISADLILMKLKSFHRAIFAGFFLFFTLLCHVHFDLKAFQFTFSATYLVSLMFPICFIRYIQGWVHSNMRIYIFGATEATSMNIKSIYRQFDLEVKHQFRT